MSPGTRSGNGAGGNGAGGFDDFDDFIRDRESEFGPSEDFGPGQHDPYRTRERSGHSGIDRGLVDAIIRILDGLGGAAGEALSPDLRRQMEKALRDLLVVLRDIINAIIERIDGRREDEFEIEEIPID